MKPLSEILAEVEPSYDGTINVDRQSYDKLKAIAVELAKACEIAIGELSSYAQGRRDQSFEGWKLEWREIEVKSDADYEYYPNHVTKEFIGELSQKLTTARKLLEDE